MFKIGIGDAVTRRPMETLMATDRKRQRNPPVVWLSSWIRHLYCNRFRQKGKDIFKKGLTDIFKKGLTKYKDWDIV